jgi:DNA-3-methyladenine glycosylase II
MTGFTITPVGAFSLQESVEFGFGQRHSERFAGVMRLAFCVDGTEEQVGVVLHQDDAGVHGVVEGTAPLDAVRGQVARVLSLDHDGTVFEEIGGRDPVIARLQRLRPGLRPPLFYSPYEAAVWAVLSTRKPAQQATDLRQRLASADGRTFVLDGVDLAALPTPAQLLAVPSFPGIPDDRLRRLHGIAEFAQAGELDPDRLLAMGPEKAMESVQRLPGIGPFYAMLIVVRGTGFVDVLPDHEPRLMTLVEQLYGSADLETISQAWRPMRTWASVLIRAAGGAVVS